MGDSSHPGSLQDAYDFGEIITSEPERVSITLSHAVSGVAYESVRISPYDVPVNLEAVLKGFVKAVEDRFTEIAPGCNIFCCEMSRRELYALLDTSLKSIPEFGQWNLTKQEMDAGHLDPNSEDRPTGMSFVSRFSRLPQADQDFVDLDAHIQNTTTLIWSLAVDEHSAIRREVPDV